jgi:hypothetical protein
MVMDYMGLACIYITNIYIYVCSEAQLALKLRGPGWIRIAAKWLGQAYIVERTLLQGQSIAMQGGMRPDESLRTFLSKIVLEGVLSAAPVQTSLKKNGLSKVSFEQQHPELRNIQGARCKRRRRRRSQSHSVCMGRRAQLQGAVAQKQQFCCCQRIRCQCFIYFFNTIDEILSLAIENAAAGMGRSGRCRCNSKFCQRKVRQVNLSSF